MSIVIIGAKGMLGHALIEVFSEEHEIFAWDREELDITDADAVRRRINEARPDIVINAAAYTDVDGAEEHEEEASRINGEAVGYLAQACVECGATLVHYSTDYVFDGENPEGYDEDDPPTISVNAYGRSKLFGEQALWRVGLERLPFFLIRTSWLYGPYGKNFVDTMLDLGRERDEIKVVNDQHGKPTYTFDLAFTTREIISNDEEYEPGAYHVTNEVRGPNGMPSGEGITWYDFAVEIFRQAKMPVRVSPVSSSEFPRPAKRPTYSMLKNTKVFLRRSWQEALEEYLEKHFLAQK